MVAYDPTRPDLPQVLYPTNSRGEVCGQGAHEGKPYMMMFDITRCFLIINLAGFVTVSLCLFHCIIVIVNVAYPFLPHIMLRCIGLSPAIEGCPTPSVCVEKCPDLTWEWEEGKVTMNQIKHLDQRIKWA